MQYRRLGRTDIEVSVVCLGSMTWGEQNTQAEAFGQIDLALDAGVNFLDCAEMYPIPPRAATQGDTESIIGNWLARSGRRGDIVLASKAAGPAADWMPHIRGGKARFDAANIELALNDSLHRLRTDYLDLYQLHWPERNTNCFGRLGYEHADESATTPFEETLEALAGQVRAGKIRQVGLSNETPWGVMRFIETAERLGLPRMASVQNPYSLLNRSFEIGLAEVAHREQVGLLAYSPLGFGVLSGKYLDGSAGPGARLNRFPDYTRYNSEQAVIATRAYVELARQHGLDPAQMALAYVNSRSFVTSNIIGATNLEQLRANIASADLTLSEALLEAIETIHTRQPNPAP